MGGPEASIMSISGSLGPAKRRRSSGHQSSTPGHSSPLHPVGALLHTFSHAPVPAPCSFTPPHTYTCMNTNACRSELFRIRVRNHTTHNSALNLRPATVCSPQQPKPLNSALQPKSERHVPKISWLKAESDPKHCILNIQAPIACGRLAKLEI